MLAESYAKAVYEHVEGGVSAEKALKNLRGVLVRKGHQKLYSAVLRALLRIARRKAMSDAPIVTLAREAETKGLKKDIAAALRELGASGEPVTILDERLIGGYTLRAGGRYLDRSYRGALTKLYRAVTKGE